MAGYQDETRNMRGDTVVFARLDFDCLDAVGSSALALERQRLCDPVLLCAFLDPFVHFSKDLFVMTRTLPKVHAIDSDRSQVHVRNPRPRLT